MYLKLFLMIFQILDIFWRLWFFHKRPTLKGKTKSSLAQATPPKILKIITNHIKCVNDAWNYMFPENMSFLAWKMRVFKIWLYDPWVQIKILHFLLSRTTEWFNQLDTEVQIWTFRPGQLISGAKWYQMPILRPFIRLGMMLVLVWL